MLYVQAYVQDKSPLVLANWELRSTQRLQFETDSMDGDSVAVILFNPIFNEHKVCTQSEHKGSICSSANYVFVAFDIWRGDQLNRI